MPISQKGDRQPGGPEVVRGPGRRQQAACPVPGVLGAFSLPSHSCRRPDEPALPGSVCPGVRLAVGIVRVFSASACLPSAPLRRVCERACGSWVGLCVSSQTLALSPSPRGLQVLLMGPQVWSRVACD